MDDVKAEIIKKAREALNLTDKEWASLDPEIQEKTLQLIDHIQDPDPARQTTQGRASVAAGIRKVLNLHPRQYDKLEDWERERFLEKVNDLAIQ